MRNVWLVIALKYLTVFNRTKAKEGGLGLDLCRLNGYMWREKLLKLLFVQSNEWNLVSSGYVSFVTWISPVI